MPIRLLPRPSSGWRNRRKAHTNSMSGSSRAIQPNVPLTIANTRSGSQPWNPHHAKVATKTPRARLNRAAPSRRSSGARSLTSWPTRRMPAPITWAMPSQAPASTRTTQGWCGSTTANCRVRAVAVVLPAVPPAAPRGRADLDAAGLDPRPGELPDLPLAFPLGAGEVRVAIPATVPDAGSKTPNFRAVRDHVVPGSDAERPPPAPP